MKSWILATLLAAGGSGGAWFWQNHYVQELVGLGEYVPADTVLYVGGTTNAAIAAQLEYVYANPNMSANIEMLARELDRAAQNESTNPAVSRFGAALVRDLLGPESNVRSVYQRLGLELNGQQQIFVDGLVPVIHLSASADTDAFVNFWAQHGRSAGLPVFSDTLAGQEFTRIQLSPVQDTHRIDLIVAQRQGMAIISFATPLDNEGELAQRLRITAPEQSLASSGKIAELAQTYGFTNDFSFILDIEGFMRAAMQLDQSRMGNDLESLFAINKEPSPVQTLTQACREEYAMLAGWTPRLVAGYTALVTSPTIALDSRSILEIKAGDVLNQLKLLNGHVPAHVKDPGSQLFGLGLGLDMDKLMPVVVQLWNQFNQQTFTCEPLRQAQARSAQTNPALMGLVTGMMQGIKGVGASLYDVQYGSVDKPVGAIDLLISVATENPALLATLASSAPFADLSSIPLDGSQAQIDLSEVQPGLFAELGLNGKHLTLAIGPKAIATAKSLQENSIEPNGLMQMSLNYPEFGKLVEAFPLDQLQPLLSDNETSLCLERAKLAELLRQQPITAGYNLSFSDAGVDSTVSISIDAPPSQANYNLVGRYQLFDQTWDCPAGVLIGYEEIRADGTGSYYEKDPSGSCDTYTYNYRWSREANRLSFLIEAPQGRDSCDAQWQTYDGYNASCQLIPNDNGFACVYEDDESEGLFAYRSIN